MTFQLGSALLEACVLAVLARGDAYGYVLTQQVGAVIEVSETALYPVPQLGQARLRQFRAEWLSYKEAVDSILLEEGQKDDQG